ncbi:16S rRNA (uracil(1498)-N(3))-methyltransferase [Lignipirellula cremea]|uniref:Ribosomal RNA small subunit methyltransferase E n=1 Tax=Lignipirellula cremea TaxID=2528010 RepID=A0A518DU10_9BACT|nr:16S rRNA (uracil(1498)-N(3))-methyltransferase [Lignipirellula cremea]QDU95323.1 Ribosomal RNA small subunit methyltransferase E [Lignipirellula cremea]
MSQRFFSETPVAGPAIELGPLEAQHLTRVMRAKVGDPLIVFDNSGAEFAAEVASIRRSAVEVRILERREIDRESPCRITIAAALPKGDRQKTMVEKLVELGVSTLVPLETTRQVARLSDNVLDRLRRTVIEASKQCGRNRLMEITEGATLPDWVQAADPQAARWLAHPGGQPLYSLATAASPAAGVCCAIGPEGGFTDEEVALAEAAGWRWISLGPRILRVETAAMALAAVLGAAAQVDAGNGP